MPASSAESGYLLVINIPGGRNFIKRSGFNVMVEAKLNGEEMTTDEVVHSESPNFNTELAWEIDRPALKIFKTQRIPVKLQCFAVDTRTATRELLGYVILDLRMVNTSPQTLKWYSLLTPKYATKPELQLSLYLEKDSKSAIVNTLQENSSSTNLSTKVEKTHVPSISASNLQSIANHLQPVLNEAEGYYQIGPASTCKDIFKLSVTIVFASNLGELIPSGIRLPEAHDGFYFHYTLFGNDVTTDAFPDILVPDFAAERAIVRIRTSVHKLKRYFSTQPDLQIQFCVGDLSIGYANVNLSSLLGNSNTAEQFMKPVTKEGTFKLQSLNKHLPASGDSSSVIGLSISISLETSKLTHAASVDDLVLNEPQNQVLDKKNIQQTVKCSNSPPVKLSTDEPSNDLHSAETENSKDEKTEEAKFTETSDSQNSKVQSSNLKHSRLAAGQDCHESMNSISEEMNSVLPELPSSNYHHYRFIVDMRYIRLLKTPDKMQCFLRYCYPFFGSSEAIASHPPVLVKSNSPVPIRHGLCAFTFAATVDHLHAALKTFPLKIDVIQQNNQIQDKVIASASLNLVSVLDAAKMPIKDNSGHLCYSQKAGQVVPVYSNDKVLGEIQVILICDDLGTIQVGDETLLRSSEQNSRSLANPVLGEKWNEVDNSKNLRQEVQVDEIDSRSLKKTSDERSCALDGQESQLQRQMAVQVALELEQWKIFQQENFQKELKNKELETLELLAKEWRKRETEREFLYQRRMSECQDMQDKLQRALADIEKREKILSSKELDLQRSKIDFEQNCIQHEREIKIGYSHLQEEFERCVKAEKEKHQETENQKTRMELQIVDLQRKLDTKSQEFETYREEQRTSPEVRLHSEVHLLAIEKSELERKLEAATKSKIHYKQQWAKALRDLARIKQRMEADARAQLYRQQQQLENMRLEYIAAESKDNGSVLQQLKTEPNTIGENVSKKLQTHDNQENISPKEHVLSFPQNDVDLDAGNGTAQYLKRERDMFLKTGIYSENDRIIQELDRQIQDLTFARSN